MKSLLKIILVAAVMLTNVALHAQQKIGHINSGDLLTSMPEMKAADANFQTYAKQATAVLTQMDTERSKTIALFQAKQKTLTEANKGTVEKELVALSKNIQDMEKALQDKQQSSEEDVAAKRSEIYQPVFKKAEDAVKLVAKEKGFSYVFDVSQPGMVYFDGGEDLMTAVKTKLGIK
ncbi:MAG TPA: OmpH family outer membrane protein [Chitinophagaceae bacterium]|jgi:outer membrane protein|nr:OmpH family outer membrane protein [Chitinophagaceae bacterium]